VAEVGHAIREVANGREEVRAGVEEVASVGQRISEAEY